MLIEKADFMTLKDTEAMKEHIAFGHKEDDILTLRQVLGLIDNEPVLIRCGRTAEDLPLFDMRPRPKASWICVTGDVCECSNCRDREILMSMMSCNYCPSCGAYMANEDAI